MVFAPLGIGRLSLHAAAEKIGSIASAAKALTDLKPSTAALKALRHPNPESFGSLLAGVWNGYSYPPLTLSFNI
jgi:hypothetical protein